MRPSRIPECTTGATRTTHSPRSWTRLGTHTCSHAFPDTRARATTGSSSLESTRRLGPRSGTDTTRSSTPSLPVQTSAATSCMLSLSDSASCSNSSSIGTARDMRLPNVWIASSGDRRSP